MYRNALFAIAGACALAASAEAATFAGFPAPGGTLYSGSGSPWHGTATWTYSGFDPSAWDQLWWGVELLQIATDGAIDESGETLSLVSMSGSTTVYEGVSSVNAGTFYTRAVLDVVSGGSDWIVPSGVGIASSDIHAVSEVDGTVDFIVDFTVTGRLNTYDAAGSGYSAYLPLFDSVTGSGENGNSRTSLYRNFYYTAAVPLPGALPLLIAALAGLGYLRRRQAA